MTYDLGAFRVYSLIVLSLFIFYRVAYCGSAPDFTLTDIDGRVFSLDDFYGRVVILNFFTSRCGACVYEVGQLKIVRDEFGDELAMISISIAPDFDTDERLRGFRDEYNISWTLARDTENVRESYDVPRIPMVFVVEKWGNIAFEHVDWVDAAVLIEEIGELLMKTPDLNLDGKVDIRDLVIVVHAYLSYPGHPRWNPMADTNQDNMVNIRDIGFVARHYGETVS